MGIVDIKIDVMRESKWNRLIWAKRQAQQSGESSNTAAAGESSNTAGEVNSDQYMDPELYRAATKGNPAELKAILNRLYPAQRGDPDEQDILERGERGQNNVLLLVSPLGNTILHVAAAHGNLSVLTEIASRSPSLISSRNYNGDSPMHLAAEAGHDNIVGELISIPRDRTGATEDQISWGTNEQGNTALHMALISSKEAVAERLLQDDPEAMFCLNKEGKSGLYLAAAAGYKDLISHTLNTYEGDDQLYGKMVQGKPPVHAAILGGKMSTLKILVEKVPQLVHSRDEKGKTPLHLAASTGYLAGVEYLFGKPSIAAVIRDHYGFFPIHWAAMKGRVDVVEELLKHSIDPAELLDRKCRNVLHTAAEHGRTNVVIYILKSPDCRKLINARDKDGNTPLHLATMNWNPRIVSDLTWNENLNVKLTNNDGLTALDVAEFYIEGLTTFQQRLTWTALTAAGTPRAPPMYDQKFPSQLNESSRPTPCIYNYQGRVNTLLVVATLIATITFAAGFTVPGGYKSSGDPHQGQATLLHRRIFSLFIFCDTIAMYSAVILTVSMIWAQLGDLNMVLVAFKVGLPLLGVSLTMMSIAFTAGIYAVVSDMHWLCHAVMIMGTTFFLTLAALSFPLCFPISSNKRISRYIAYYPFQLLMYVTKSGISSNWEEEYISK